MVKSAMYQNLFLRSCVLGCGMQKNEASMSIVFLALVVACGCSILLNNWVAIRRLKAPARIE